MQSRVGVGGAGACHPKWIYVCVLHGESASMSVLDGESTSLGAQDSHWAASKPPSARHIGLPLGGRWHPPGGSKSSLLRLP